MNVKKLVLGTVQMGLSYGINNKTGKITNEESIKLLNFAYNNNMTTLDTAAAYGNAHEIIGEYHKLNPTKKFNVITKFPHHFKMDTLMNEIGRYKEQMHVDLIDTILFHSYQDYFVNKNNLNNLKSLKTNGVINKIGVSIYTNEQFETVIEDQNIEIIQLPFNLLDNYNLRGELLQKAKNKGKIIQTRSVFLQGIFFADRNSEKSAVKNLLPELKVLDEIAADYNISMQSLALNYSLQQNNIDQVLIGVDSIEQLNINLQQVNFLDEQIIDAINNIKITNFDVLNPSLW